MSGQLFKRMLFVLGGPQFLDHFNEGGLFEQFCSKGVQRIIILLPDCIWVERDFHYHKKVVHCRPPLCVDRWDLRTPKYFYYGITYRANSMALVSRITITLISPGYLSSFSMRSAMVRASSRAWKSLNPSGLTNTRTSRPAEMA